MGTEPIGENRRPGGGGNPAVPLRRLGTFWRWAIAVSVASLVLFLGGFFAARTERAPRVAPGNAQTLAVSMEGSDERGNGSAEKPYRTIARALALAQPGTTILVRSGTYREYLRTRADGTAEAPIVLRATGAVRLTSDGEHGRIADIWNDHYVIEGFEFSEGDILLWLQEADGNIIRENVFHRARGECVRVKYQSNNNLFERNRVEDCGLDDFAGGRGGKNGEGIYIGTPPEQLSKNPTPEIDRSDGNVVRNNAIATRGNECVDVKEGSSGTVVEFNDCTGQRDPESAGFDARGNRNVFRYNRTYGNVGAGIRFGGDGPADGIENDAYGNDIAENGGAAIKVTRLPQGTVCGNRTDRNRGGVSNRREIVNGQCAFPLSSPGVQSPNVPQPAAAP